MIKAPALHVATDIGLEWLRMAIVYGCAAALALAGVKFF